MICIIFGKTFHHKTIYTEAKFCFSGLVLPKPSFEGNWIIDMWLHLINKLIVCYDG